MAQPQTGEVYRAQLEPVRGLPGTCPIRRGEAGLPHESVALAFQLRALEASRLEKRYGKVSAPTLEAVTDAILDAFGIHFGRA